MSLWRHGDVLRLWAGQTVSEPGSQVSAVAVPLTAVTVLGGGPVETGCSAPSRTCPSCSSAFPRGVERRARRPLLVAADAGRALALASVPVSWALGRLCMAYLPALVERHRLVAGNSRLAPHPVGRGGGPVRDVAACW
jgi:hypothetical protein